LHLHHAVVEQGLGSSPLPQRSLLALFGLPQLLAGLAVGQLRQIQLQNTRWASRADTG
jgi:hypothetical protein